MRTLPAAYEPWLVIVAGILAVIVLNLLSWHVSRLVLRAAAAALRGRTGQTLLRRASPILTLARQRFPRLSASVRARTRVDRFSGLPLTLMAAAALYVASLFGGVVEDVMEADEIVMFDMAVTQALTPFREGPLLSFFLWITRFGDTATLVAVTIVSAGFLWADRRTAYAWPLWIAVVGSQATTWAGKYGFGRGRPEFLTAETAVSPAFPSAHATGAAAVYGFVAYAIVRENLSRRQRFEVTYWTLILIALIGFSRIYLNVHFTSDVLAGFLVGGFWLLVAMTLAEYMRQRIVDA